MRRSVARSGPRLRFDLLVAVLGTSLAVGACAPGGGAAPATAGPTAAPAATTNSSPTATVPGATQAPAASTSSGGGTAAGPCALVTSDEMAHALGTAALTSKVAYGTACQYGDGTTYVAAVQPSIDASIIELAFKAPGNSVVEGVGDRAVYSAASHALLFVKGATGVSIALNLAAGLRSPELDVLKQLGLIAAARL